MIGFNGGLIGKVNSYKLTGANPGVWTLNEQMIAKRSGPSASGGVETFATIGGVSYKVHTFTADGTLTFTVGGNVDYLVIAGGGGGGGGYQGGGGGAGGYLTGTTPASVQAYTITVGAGGTGCRKSGSNIATNGGNSVFSSFTATGGGRGASENPNAAAAIGGSGGGGANTGGLTGAAGTSGQGFAGGNGLNSDTNYGGGGGGSSAAAAHAVNGDTPPLGGAGTSINFDGTGSTTYARGGNGSKRSSNTTAPTNAASSLGNGGTGASDVGGGGVGANGGSGIVIIRYPV